MIGGAIAWVTGGRGGRGSAEDRNRAAHRACGAGGKRADGPPVNMAVQDRLGAEVTDDAFKCDCIRSPRSGGVTPERGGW